MGACLLLGPMDSFAVDKLLDFLFQVPTLKYIDFSICQFLNVNQGFQEEDYLLLSDVLASHFKKKWLSAKRKCKSAAGDEQQVFHKNSKKRSVLLDTIPEEISESIPPAKSLKFVMISLDFLKVAKGGLFFLLGIELMSTFLPAELHTPVRNVPIVWKLHALSVALLSGMGIFEEDNSRDLYKALQDVYGQLDREVVPFHTDDDERILEAYCKSWVSGALDKAARRGSASFCHHLFSRLALGTCFLSEAT
ncbi:hypothetical protein RND71_000047 [Anisodus tanguticus]|uniref:Uncharacterized protein n=1 Tax=Anisodus tanguticus TaxID=243964 RepID=A0AAE1SYR8_9SOLA|nr:hypothetical protein RND71_000047 [Anisodus tanguticus]